MAKRRAESVPPDVGAAAVAWPDACVGHARESKRQPPRYTGLGWHGKDSDKTMSGLRKYDPSKGSCETVTVSSLRCFLAQLRIPRNPSMRG